MNINKLVKDTLKPFGFPCKYEEYKGKETSYITFFEMNNIDDEFSDDSEECEVHSLQIDFFTKSDPNNIKKEIKKALKTNFSEVTFQDLYESDTKYYHICFRCYYYEYKEEK